MGSWSDIVLLMLQTLPLSLQLPFLVGCLTAEAISWMRNLNASAIASVSCFPISRRPMLHICPVGIVTSNPDSGDAIYWFHLHAMCFPGYSFGLHWPALPSAINLTSSSKWERTVLMGSLSMPFSASLLSTVLMTLTLFMEGTPLLLL